MSDNKLLAVICVAFIALMVTMVVSSSISHSQKECNRIELLKLQNDSIRLSKLPTNIQTK